MLIGMLFTSFAAAYWNLFDQSEQEFFDEFQLYSERLVEIRILYREKTACPYGYLDIQDGQIIGCQSHFGRDRPALCVNLQTEIG